MKKNNTSNLKIDLVIIMITINAVLLSGFMESIMGEVSGMLSSNTTLLPTSNTTLLPTSNTTLLPTSNATENETDQSGTISSFPGSLDSDRRHMPLV